jgi:hypothetical protein
LPETNRPGARRRHRERAGRIPRISRLMALAIRIHGLVSEGRFRDYAEVAHLGHVSRARLSQILNLLNLDPAIQEAVLFLPRIVAGADRVTEKRLMAWIRMGTSESASFHKVKKSWYAR